MCFTLCEPPCIGAWMERAPIDGLACLAPSPSLHPAYHPTAACLPAFNSCCRRLPHSSDHRLRPEAERPNQTFFGGKTKKS